MLAATTAAVVGLLPGGPASAHYSAVDHPVSVTKVVSLIKSKADGCSFNTSPYGPACATPSVVNVSAPAFGGTPNGHAVVVLCNEKLFTATSAGGNDDVGHGCDYANARGLATVIAGFPASSGTFTLDGSGNLPGSVPLTLTSCNEAGVVPDLLTQLGGSTCSNVAYSSATCPPTASAIAAGWNCTIGVFDWDPMIGPVHAGWVHAYLKSPIPSMTCNGGPCGATIAPGTTLRMGGVRFPCKTLTPDDPTVPGNQGACSGAWTNKQILVKRTSTQLLEGPAITPTSQTAALDGSYTIIFTMPNLSFDGESYKLVPHAPTCAAPCDSGKFNAAGKFVIQ